MSKLDIVNRALVRVGTTTIRNLEDPNIGAKTALLMYQSAEDIVMRSHPWACAVTKKALISTDDIDRIPGGEYLLGDYCINNGILYLCTGSGITALSDGPNTEALNIRDGTAYWDALAQCHDNASGFTGEYIYPSDCQRVLAVNDEPYQIMGWFIYTNTTDPIARYIQKIINVETFDSLMSDAISAKLAVMIAPAFGQNAIVMQLIQEYQLALRLARNESASESKEEPAQEKLWTDF